MIRTLPLSLLCCLWSCSDKAEDPVRDPVYLTAGAPMAGVADAVIDFPMGAPMGGYSNRCDYLGRNGSIDNRRSPLYGSMVVQLGHPDASQSKSFMDYQW